MNFNKLLNTPVIDQVRNLMYKSPKQMFDLGARFVGYFVIGWIAIFVVIFGFIAFLIWAIHATATMFIAGLLLLLLIPLVKSMKKGDK